MIVIQSSYLSQQTYYPGLVDTQDNHNGLMSKEQILKNRITLEELRKSIDSSGSSPVDQVRGSRNSVWTSAEANSIAFKMQAYAQVVCPLGNAIIKEEGLHKRAVHWVPSVQVRCAPSVGRVGSQDGGGIPSITSTVAIEKTQKSKRVRKKA